VKCGGVLPWHSQVSRPAVRPQEPPPADRWRRLGKLTLTLALAGIVLAGCGPPSKAERFRDVIEERYGSDLPNLSDAEIDETGTSLCEAIDILSPIDGTDFLNLSRTLEDAVGTIGFPADDIVLILWDTYCPPVDLE
jgi:hypothetical protein